MFEIFPNRVAAFYGKDCPKCGSRFQHRQRLIGSTLFNVLQCPDCQSIAPDFWVSYSKKTLDEGVKYAHLTDEQIELLKALA